jgi:hypothetical protein
MAPFVQRHTAKTKANSEKKAQDLHAQMHLMYKFVLFVCRNRGPARREDQQDPERGEQVPGECGGQASLPSHGAPS